MKERLTEKEKMLAGQLYDASDPELVRERKRARDLTYAYNRTTEDHWDERRRIIAELFGRSDADTYIEPPFYCDYGANIYLGNKVFFNFNCVVLDVCPVTIGDKVLF